MCIRDRNNSNNGNYSEFLLLVLQAVERSLDIYLGSLTNIYEDYLPVSQIVEDPHIPYSQEYVSLLARQGKIDSFKEGRNWMTSRQGVLNYIRDRDRKRILTS